MTSFKKRSPFHTSNSQSIMGAPFISLEIINHVGGNFLETSTRQYSTIKLEIKTYAPIVSRALIRVFKRA